MVFLPVLFSKERAKRSYFEEVEVIDADPKRIFDKEAKRALRKWKYKPKVVDGTPLRQTGLTVQLDFKMGT